VKNLFEQFVYHLIASSVWLLGSMPLSWSRCCGLIFGRVWHLLSQRRRRITRENLAIAFPDSTPADLKELTRKMFANLGQLIFEIFWSYRQDQKTLSDHFRLEGREHIERAYAKGQGVLVLSAHFGNWEVMTLVEMVLGYPVSIVYRPLDYPPLERFVIKLRTRFGARQIPRKKAFRKTIRALEEKHMVGILFDQHVSRKEGVFVNFFGRPVSTSQGLALLAMKTGAPVVPLFLLREKEGFCARFLPELPLTRTGDKFEDIKRNTEHYNGVIEDMIRRYPEQWLWLHRRWRGDDIRNWEKQEKLDSSS
jgi:KDO2-lipid IV(A) lauroyltransferase